MYVERGLIALRREIIIRKIHSIAIPPLGSHNGGLDWSRVKPMIFAALEDLDCDIHLYEPSVAIIEKGTDQTDTCPCHVVRRNGGSYLLWRV